MIHLFKQKNKKGVSLKLATGFTLVETLIAIFIFSISITVILSVLANGISDINFSKRKMTAQYLAQEGIEYVRNARDTYVLFGSSAGWTNFVTKFSSCNSSGNGCYVDSTSLNFTYSSTSMSNIFNITLCGGTGTNCEHLQYNPNDGKYSYNSSYNSIDSGFARIIKTNYDSIGDMKVSSTVYWVEKGITRNVSFSEDLYNWVET
jgi:type II secretory pathway pseudopilin PulG